MLLFLFLFGLVFRVHAWNFTDPKVVEDYVLYIAHKEDVPAQLAWDIAKCESKFNPLAIGDNGNSYGVFQIHLPSHPYITKEQAINPAWNANWAISQMSLGKFSMWSCFKQRAML